MFIADHEVIDLENNKGIQSIRGWKDLTAKGIPEKNRKGKEQQIKITKGPKDMWKEPRTEKMNRKKAAGKKV